MDMINFDGLLIGIATFLIIGLFSSGCGKSGILLGYEMLVDLSRFGNSGNCRFPAD